MAGEGDDPPKDFDRLSLGSLKRELEVQKSKTEMVREEARERLRLEEQKKKAFPWAIVLAIVIGGAGLFFGVVFLLRESIPAVANYVLPAFVYVAPDAGPPPVDAWVAPDVGDDAHVAHTHHPHPPASSGTGTGDDLGLGDLGHGTDPIEGVGTP